MKGATALLVLAVIGVAFADVYMHNPRGSNDRLNERDGNRQNANRIYDSQDNAAGGYAWGPKMYFFVGSKLDIQWTNQHSCNTGNNHCELILQYTCDEQVTEVMRDGTTTNRVPDDEEQQKDKQFGRQETWKYYQDCKARERNKGLYIADRAVGNNAITTRQNNDGTRSGFECPEERDYYPYWHPSPWVDVAVLTSNTTRCDYYKKESQNSVGKGSCSNPRFNNPTSCSGNGGTWKTSDAWAKIDATKYPPPECLPAPVMRDNHLGSANREDGQMASYMWTIPDTPSANCVLRLRYNISTNDYDWNLDAKGNAGNSPIKQDPTVSFGDFCGPNKVACNLTMALNTNQYGRTFQDRSFMFEIRARPSYVAAGDVIHNLNVRGKRGNIVQAYPAVEYDFVPTHLTTKVGEFVHFQWTGSEFNANDGNNNAEGTAGTDYNNIVQIKDHGANKPAPVENCTMFDDKALCRRMATVGQWDDWTAEQKANPPCRTYAEILADNPNNNDNREQDPTNCAKLNAAPLHFDGGLVKMNSTGEYYYMSTRNNNFSNRSQKGILTVDPAVSNIGLVLIIVGAGAVVLAGAAAFAWKKGKLPFFQGPQ